MKKQTKKKFYIGAGLLTAFVLWTVAVRSVEVRPIGPDGSTVGFATLNGFVHRCIGVHMALYTLTDWLSLVPIAFVAGFAVLGLVQWIKRKHILKVDRSLLALGGFYIIVMAAYLLFETVVINYRPLLIAGVLEASYPSSTTMLVLCVMPTAVHQLRTRIHSAVLRKVVTGAGMTFALLMVVLRLIAGVHWITDIIGGILLSAGLVMLYLAVNQWITIKNPHVCVPEL